MKKIGLLLIVMIVLSACEKVIDVDLNESNPKYVIECEMELGNHEFRVSISQTSSYFEADTVLGVEGAAVILSNDRGDDFPLFEYGDGIYVIPFFLSGSGQEYTLRVEIEDEIFEAKALMPNLVVADTVLLRDDNRPEITFTDPSQDENYYRIQLYRNGEQIDANRRFNQIVVDDLLTNGSTTTQTLGTNGGFGDNDDPIVSGDELIVKLQSMDSRGFKFFSTLQDVSGGNGPGGAAPGNPVGNWSNGALGYFTAVATDSHTLIVP